jgi:sRNA-binding carbon storage regulator CsrA
VRFDGPKRTAGVRRITEGGGMLILSRLALFSNRHKKRRDPNGDDRASRFDIFCPDGSVIRLTAIEARANEGIVRIGIEAPAEYRIVRADAKTQEKQEKQEKGDAIDDRDSCGCDERVA